jgi:hypothetical protein
MSNREADGFPDVQCRISDAQQTTAADPGNWVYLAVHSDASGSCRSSCCYSAEQFKYISVLYPSANAAASKLAELFCKHVVTTFAAKTGYKQQSDASCPQPKPVFVNGQPWYTSMEVHPNTMGSLAPILVELGFHDSIADLTWWNDHRQGAADAFVAMFQEYIGGALQRATCLDALCT